MNLFDAIDEGIKFLEGGDKCEHCGLAERAMIFYSSPCGFQIKTCGVLTCPSFSTAIKPLVRAHIRDCKTCEDMTKRAGAKSRLLKDGDGEEEK